MGASESCKIGPGEKTGCTDCSQCDEGQYIDEECDNGSPFDADGLFMDGIVGTDTLCADCTPRGDTLVPKVSTSSQRALSLLTLSAQHAQTRPTLNFSVIPISRVVSSTAKRKQVPRALWCDVKLSRRKPVV